MKLCFILYFLTIGLGISCSDTHKQTIVDTPKAKNNSQTKRKPLSSFQDTIKINYPSAVFYHPDSLQLKKIQAITDTMVFKSIIHELFYQMRYSRIVLKKYYPHIKIIEITNARWLFFVNADGIKEYIDLNTQNDAEGLFVFDSRKAPRLIDMTNIETELGFYFPK